MLGIILLCLAGLVAILLFTCLSIPRPRKFFWFMVRDSMRIPWEILIDYAPSKKISIQSFLMFLLAIILMIPLAVFCLLICLVAYPTASIIHSLAHPERVDNILDYDREIHAPRPVKPKRTPQEIEAEDKAFREKYFATHFTVPVEDIVFQPDIFEVIFYAPSPVPEMEKLINDNLDSINDALKTRRLRLFFLPEYNRCFEDYESAERLSYFNPRYGSDLERPAEVLTYDDIKHALRLPERVDAPCFIRYNNTSSGSHYFSFWRIEIKDGQGLLDAVEEYINSVGDGCLYNIGHDDDLEWLLEGLPADDRFYDDVKEIGKEIRERVDKLRSWGMSSLAIRKLIGDDADKPGKLLINRHNKLILTDFGNKEIKLEPLQKAVFFLFLRHPEGIYFKDLGDYKEELGALYLEITGRDDLAGIQDSINKLTDPLNNSINEKCARIKNAFVSEFREEVAQWYFIDGNRGEKKRIRLPRELVTWEIRD